MVTRRMLFVVVCVVSLTLGSLATLKAEDRIKLSAPAYKGKMSVEAAIRARQTARNFQRAPLTLRQVSQLLWAANGKLPADAITGATWKTTPSAGGLYPIELFIVTGNGTVTNLPAGVYGYDARANTLTTVVPGDKRTLLAHAALSQMWLARAPVVVLITGVFSRSTGKYGNRGINYVFMESGSADQNLCLQAQALGLRSGTVGAFQDSQVSAALKLPSHAAPLLIVAVGK